MITTGTSKGPLSRWSVVAALAGAGLMAGPAAASAGDERRQNEHPGSDEGPRAGGELGERADGASADLGGLPEPSGDIRIFAPSVQVRAEVELFDGEGAFDDEALADLDEVFQCQRTGDERAVSPRLYVLLSHIYDEFGEEVELASGFRNQQNEGSRHYHASAMDIRVSGVGIRELAEFADGLDREDGPNLGIGRYPRSGFVHVDIRAPGEPSYRWIQVGNRHRSLGIPDS